MSDPVVRISRVFVRDKDARAVGQEGSLRGGELNRAQIIAKTVENWLEHARMRCDVDGDPLTLDIFRAEALLQPVERRFRPRSHAQPRPVYTRQVEIFPQIGFQLLR